MLADVGKAIDARDSARFVNAYEQALEGCYGCHKAAGKPFIRPQMPTAPGASILSPDPRARWPE